MLQHQALMIRVLNVEIFHSAFYNQKATQQRPTDKICTRYTCFCSLLFLSWPVEHHQTTRKDIGSASCLRRQFNFFCPLKISLEAKLTLFLEMLPSNRLAFCIKLAFCEKATKTLFGMVSQMKSCVDRILAVAIHTQACSPWLRPYILHTLLDRLIHCKQQELIDVQGSASCCTHKQKKEMKTKNAFHPIPIIPKCQKCLTFRDSDPVGYVWRKNWLFQVDNHFYCIHYGFSFSLLHTI